jgi:hypothetical protein
MFNKLTKYVLLVAFILGMCHQAIEAKARGKTYDDLANMLKTANNKISDEQEKQSVNDKAEIKQDAKSAAKSGANAKNNDAVPAGSTAITASPLASNPKTPTATLKAPDNFKEVTTPIHSHKKEKKADDLGALLTKKKHNEDTEGIKLRSVTIPRKTGDNE